ncbi:nicotinate-nucleotide pyrophosphorylase [Owenweeksia hongkongensis DSM 17368]|uniref:Probable nicotinate-nucleotide pyrophosphorylase [carboxylating] n=1 Tax=Owenweeksia hongkongensis (strain DSM 17368 / CIP 108786 / JCM 12287 / NRRL B-23963 / UST20020801) TaxID=926562 RepID=G8R7M7_OWEHD|nr:carboxylating nicotinate-nucleotide diphosphorylase [Owenweeksia hongkongensis]AEV32380.1 nicotinate-nucleotide pyrophosphorylase [Owenweeksia hongkongensis DSM 17368]
MISKDYLDRFIDDAIAEDIGPGDHSSNCSIPATAEGKMYLLVKEEGIIAGIDVAKRVFEKVDPAIKMEILMRDGDAVKLGDIAFRLQGPERALLRSERLALNIMQRMSGIATRTHHIVKLIEGTPTKLLDTRKTTPNMRALEKYAVTVGGGYNHRMGLYDMIMLKDNHVDFAGGIINAIDKAHEYIKENGLDIGIEVETRNLEELQQVIDKGGVQRVMFDNYSIEDTIKALNMVGGKFETESSGGITETTIRSYAETGVDFISVGALTHSVKSLDLSLKAE